MKDVEYTENTNLKTLSSVRIGGTADLVVKPKRITEMVSALNYIKEIGVIYKIIGKASNILFSDNHYSGIVVCTDGIRSLSLSDRFLIAETGCFVPYVSAIAAKNSLCGLEPLCGIPGTLGGAILGNAGAFGRSISDMVVDVCCLDVSTGEIIVLNPKDLDFSYRHCAIKDRGLVVLTARLSLAADDSDKIHERIEAFREYRRQTQPTEPSLGSVFKRPKRGYCGEMIEQCGLKGAEIGDAQISAKHAGFIVNKGEASASDFRSLMDLASAAVYNKFSVLLEPEIEIM